MFYFITTTLPLRLQMVPPPVQYTISYSVPEIYETHWRRPFNFKLLMRVTDAGSTCFRHNVSTCINFVLSSFYVDSSCRPNTRGRANTWAKWVDCGLDLWPINWSKSYRWYGKPTGTYQLELFTPPCTSGTWQCFLRLRSFATKLVNAVFEKMNRLGM